VAERVGILVGLRARAPGARSLRRAHWAMDVRMNVRGMSGRLLLTIAEATVACGSLTTVMPSAPGTRVSPCLESFEPIPASVFLLFLHQALHSEPSRQMQFQFSRKRRVVTQKPAMPQSG
jgi:hypothetical protein